MRLIFAPLAAADLEEIFEADLKEGGAPVIGPGGNR
jgi:hypothetical protein